MCFLVFKNLLTFTVMVVYSSCSCCFSSYDNGKSSCMIVTLSLVDNSVNYVNDCVK